MTKLPRYTDEQLSMILSEAAAGRLGEPYGDTRCVEQTAWQSDSDGTDGRMPRGWSVQRMKSFDNLQTRELTASAEEIEAWLRREGLL